VACTNACSCARACAQASSLYGLGGAGQSEGLLILLTLGLQPYAVTHLTALTGMGTFRHGLPSFASSYSVARPHQSFAASAFAHTSACSTPA